MQKNSNLHVFTNANFINIFSEVLRHPFSSWFRQHLLRVHNWRLRKNADHVLCLSNSGQIKIFGEKKKVRYFKVLSVWSKNNAL